MWVKTILETLNSVMTAVLRWRGGNERNIFARSVSGWYTTPYLKCYGFKHYFKLWVVKTHFFMSKWHTVSTSPVVMKLSPTLTLVLFSAGCSCARQGVPGVQRPGEEAAAWSGGRDRPTPSPGAAEHGAQDEPGRAHQQDPPATGQLS